MKKKGRPVREARASEIKRLYKLGWAVPDIAHHLCCSTQLVEYHAEDKNGTKLRPGPKSGSKYVSSGWDGIKNKISEAEIDELFKNNSFN
jgi:hypothetical protein